MNLPRVPNSRRIGDKYGFTSIDYRRLADFAGHEPDDAVLDVPVLRRMVSDPKWAINKFFVDKGDAWLHTTLHDFQSGVVDRAVSGSPQVCEILPRGHTKTTLGSRIIPALDIGLSKSRYTVIFSLTEDGWEGNLEAMWEIYNGPEFEDLQWLLRYVHGPELVQRRGSLLIFGNGSIIEYRSLLGESRGLNRPSAGGRPDTIILDDIIPTDAIESPTIRQKIERRYLSMIRPLGRRGAKLRISGTIMHSQDLINKIASGRIKGWVVTPEEHRRAYDETTKEVLFKTRWSYDELMMLYQNEYVATGNVHLWRREMLNDPSEDDTHPLTRYEFGRHDPNGVRMEELYRVIAVDHSHGTGNDKFVVIETGTERGWKIRVLDCFTSRSVNIQERMDAVIMFVRRRRPNKLVIEKTTESRSFIEVLEKQLRDYGYFFTIETPHAGSTRGAKNEGITSYLQPHLAAGNITLPRRDDRWIHELDAERANFDKTNDQNADDMLDALRYCVKFSIEPTAANFEYKTGNRMIDEIRAQMVRATFNKGAHRRNRPRVNWRR